MSDMFNKLFETGILGEEVRSDLQEAWDAKIKENKDTVTAELREEFANRYVVPAWSAIHVLTVESFPTDRRATALGIFIALSRAGALLGKLI